MCPYNYPEVVLGALADPNHNNGQGKDITGTSTSRVAFKYGTQV
jgi:hypothetical protein